MTQLLATIEVSLPCAFLLIVTLTKISACPIMCTCNETTDALIVDCSSQNLTSIPAPLPVNTTHLILRDNRLETLKSLNNCVALQKLIVLDLSWNQILQLNTGEFLDCKEVQYLDLSYNNIETLPSQPFWGLTKAELVDLSGNSIYKMDDGAFIDLLSLKELRLHDNLLCNNGTGEALIPRETLEILDLSKNKIQKLKHPMFKNLENLKTLSLRTNNIKVVEEDALINQGKLENLDLSYNPLYGLPESMFETLTDLTYLELSADSLAAISKLADSMNYTHYWFRVIKNMKGVLKEMPGYQNGTDSFTDQKMGIRYMEEASISSAAVLNVQELPNTLYAQRVPNSNDLRETSHEHH